MKHASSPSVVWLFGLSFFPGGMVLGVGVACPLFIHPLEIMFTQLYEDYEVSQTLAPLQLGLWTSISELQFDFKT